MRPKASSSLWNSIVGGDHSVIFLLSLRVRLVAVDLHVALECKCLVAEKAGERLLTRVGAEVTNQKHGSSKFLVAVVTGQFSRLETR